MDELESMAFGLFAQAYPHEAYESWPERFWKYFHSKFPKLSREQMETILRETDEQTEAA